MAADPLRLAPEPEVVDGHPTVELHIAGQPEPTLLTVCADCGQLRTILFLSKDHWLCFNCRTTGAVPPALYPIA